MKGVPPSLLSEITPAWDDDVPLCTNRCPWFRAGTPPTCREDQILTTICAPAVQEITTQLRAYQGQEQHKCHHCGVLPNQESDEDEQCPVCGRGGES